MKSNKIIFKAQNKEVSEVRLKPTPAVNYIPSWWKKIPKYANERNKFEMDPGPSITVKQCAPIKDVMGSGYIIPLWSDIFVSQRMGVPVIQWSSSKPVVDVWHPEQSSNFISPEGFNKMVFKYMHGWIVKTPPGWSTLFMHPVGYNDLPIRSISGIVDTDILNTEINCPFFVKEGFEGIIEKGTPMAQIIPIHRSNWQAEFQEYSDSEYSIESEKLLTKLYGYYHSLREKKVYK